MSKIVKLSCCSHAKQLLQLSSLKRVVPCSELLWRSFSDQPSHRPRVCIVGSGPAGFYTAQYLLKQHDSLLIDIFDRLPVPFGLVRYGVAPDHPEVKNVITTFSKTATAGRCTFYGNIHIGSDVTLSELRSQYDAIVLSYGSEGEKKLGIPGEDLEGVMSAKQFVGWYNGYPAEKDLKMNFDTHTGVVLGQGNVAIDVCRVLLTSPNKLKETDMTHYAIRELSKTQIRTVHCVGRRGPLQVAFTIKELREMISLHGCTTMMDKVDFDGVPRVISDLPRPRKRLMELLTKTALESMPVVDLERYRAWRPRFYRTPEMFLPDRSGTRVAAVRCRVNRLEGSLEDSSTVVPTDEFEDIPCGLVIRSIGFQNSPLDGVPFDFEENKIPNVNGKVTGTEGLYCSGWIKTGPIGVIVNSMTNSFETAKCIIDDINTGRITVPSRDMSLDDAIPAFFKRKGVRYITFEDWLVIDEIEKQRGKSLGKPREKITDIEEMLNIAEVHRKNGRTVPPP